MIDTETDITARLTEDAEYIDNYDGFVGNAGRIVRTMNMARAEIKQLRAALEPFAIIGRALQAATPDNRWLEMPMFYAGTDNDPQCMTLTGKAFDRAAKAAGEQS